jgi:hypothetical protein
VPDGVPDAEGVEFWAETIERETTLMESASSPIAAKPAKACRRRYVLLMMAGSFLVYRR